MTQTVQYMLNQFGSTVEYVEKHHAELLLAADAFVKHVRAGSITLHESIKQGWRVGQTLRYFETLFDEVLEDWNQPITPSSEIIYKPLRTMNAATMVNTICSGICNSLPASSTAKNRYDLMTKPDVQSLHASLEYWFDNGKEWLRHYGFYAVFGRENYEFPVAFDLVGDTFLGFVVHDRINNPITTWLVCCYRVLSLINAMATNEYYSVQSRWRQLNSTPYKKDGTHDSTH